MASLGRVLVVDDDPEVGLVLHDSLAEVGYNVRVAVNGAEALALLESYRPDVVLLDIQMPGLPGDAVLEEIKRREPALPVIMVTANRDEELARNVLAAAFDYIPKPFDLAVLERVVTAAVAAHGRRAP
jgi:two-component system, OmpR family, response regulator MprA